MSAIGSWRNANERMKDEDITNNERNYLEGVKSNAVMSGLMSVGQGVNGILNPALQAAEIGDTTMYHYDIDNIAHLGTGPYYDFDQLGGDYANANLNMKPIEASDVRGMTTKEKWGTRLTGAAAGAKAGWEVGGVVGAGVGTLVGWLGSEIGIQAGNRKAEREAVNLNNQAEIASAMAQKNFGAAFERVADRKNRQYQSNIASEGGKITKAASDRHMTIKQFADATLAQQRKDKYQQTMDARNKFSAGGSIYNTHGGYFAPDLIKIQTGGTHEENPFGGIQMGVDPMGTPNLVEEGEVIYNDYVFSDRLTATESLLKDFALPKKYAGKSFAYIADKLSDEAKERPEDAISNNGMGAMYDRLMGAQDYLKAKREEARLKRELKKMSPEELAGLAQQMGVLQPVPEEDAMPEEQTMAAPMGEQMPVMAEGGRLANYYDGETGDSTLRTRNYTLQVPMPAALRLDLSHYQYLPPPQRGPWVPSNPTYDNDWSNNNWLLDNEAQDAAWDAGIHKEIDPVGVVNNDNLSWRDAGVAARNAGQGTFTWRGKQYSVNDLGQGIGEPPLAATTSRPHYGVEIEKNPHYQQFVEWLGKNKDTDAGKAWLKQVAGDNDYDWWLKNATDGKPGRIHDATYDAAEEWFDLVNAPIPDINTDINIEPVDVQQFNFNGDLTANPMTMDEARGITGEQTGTPMLPTWQRYAGAGYNMLSALHNMFQEPDRYQYRRFNPSYTYGDLALDRVEYNPYDYNLAANQLNAADAATRAQIANSGMGPSTGATLLAQNYNAGRNLGNAYWQTQLANQQQKANAIAANNQAAQAEANFAYQRDAGNTNIRNQYGLYNLQNAIQADYLNKQAETQKWQAVSQALDASATDLSRIGQENFNMNMANSNPALFYYLNGNGLVGYKDWLAQEAERVERLR